MFKLFLFLAVSVATTSAADYRVTEVYSDSACTTLVKTTYDNQFEKMGCSCGVKYTKVAGGLTSNAYSENQCTGTVSQGVGGFQPDKSCTLTIFGKYETTSWKTSLPLTAADIPKGKLLLLSYWSCVALNKCEKKSEFHRGRYLDMDTCLDKGRPHEYKLTRNPKKPTEILSTPNCTVPGTPVVRYSLNQCLNTVEAGYGSELAILGGDTELSGAASTASLCTLLALLSVMTSFVLA